ncbi:MAG: HAD family hydrolase [Lachnospiraceae bacterium]|jgi:phosphoglycolate phosphatase
MKYKAAVFDMDGTVLDTAGDLCDSMNHVMGQLGLPAGFTIEDTHYLFGSGVTVAVSRALAMLDGADYKTLLTVGTEEDEVTRTLDPALREKVQNMFRSYYGQHCSIKTGPYPGIPALLMRLREHGVHTAVVSNKPDPAVQELVDIHFKGLFDRALGESPAIRRKPAPDMTRKIVEELGIMPEEAVYIGDTEIDLQTAENSGTGCICVDWGFRTKDFLTALGAPAVVSSADELGDLILSGANKRE